MKASVAPLEYLEFTFAYPKLTTSSKKKKKEKTKGNEAENGKDAKKGNKKAEEGKEAEKEEEDDEEEPEVPERRPRRPPGSPRSHARSACLPGPRAALREVPTAQDEAQVTTASDVAAAAGQGLPPRQKDPHQGLLRNRRILSISDLDWPARERVVLCQGT